jgi:predicted nucleic acid-binding protein
VIVIDANIAIKWVVDQAHSDRAREIVARGIHLVVPNVFVAEVANAIWGYVRNRGITSPQAQAALGTILQQISLIDQDADLAGEALSIGSELNYSPYDFFYVVLAMRRNAPMVTADQRLINRLAGTRYRSRVVHLADWT